VVILQHPRETSVAIGTARLAHLGLINSELHVGVDFGERAILDQLVAARDRTALLFPSPEARELSSLAPDERPETLVVVDGTWSLAAKLIRRNPRLALLPKVRFTPSRPGNYRIRPEPAAHCVSTLEAITSALALLDGEEQRFESLLRAFERMVDIQLEKTAERQSPPRRKLPRKRALRPRVPPELFERYPDLVLLYAEANAQPLTAQAAVPTELIQWLALRPSTGETFGALLTPRQSLAPSTPQHLELPEASFAQGESVASAGARWRSFLKPADLVCSWGSFSQRLLASEGLAVPPTLDLRLAACRVLRRRPAGLEAGAALLAPEASPVQLQPGRAGRRLAALTRVLEKLREVRDPRPPTPHP
jgi:DTW domain-containing protein YfiP